MFARVYSPQFFDHELQSGNGRDGIEIAFCAIRKLYKTDFIFRL